MNDTTTRHNIISYAMKKKTPNGTRSYYSASNKIYPLL